MKQVQASFETKREERLLIITISGDFDLVSTEAQRILAYTYTAARYFTPHSTPNKVFDQQDEALGWTEEQDS
jgi:hypothetical protein